MKILLACGGTGGHIFPAFSVAEELKRRNPAAEIVYVCGNKDIEDQIFKIVVHERVIPIESAALPRGAALLNPTFLLKLIEGFSQAKRLLRTEKPDAVVGFGGHFSFPVVLMARVLGFKTLIHEQNVKPGAANRVLRPWVRGIAVSFPETLGFFPKRRNVYLTGNPIRSAIETAPKKEALSFFGFSENKKTLLVLGGSQGAGAINTLFLAALPLLPAWFKEKVQVLHLCGKMPKAEAARAFQKAGLDARVYSFFDRMDLAYAAADFALGRAGATFLAEIAFKNIPAVLVPYPHGDGHQRENARVYSRTHRACVTEQSELTPAKLKDLIVDYAGKNFKADDTDGNFRADTNARILLADCILGLAQK